MVRQYKLHLDLDGENNKVWDVTNGKVRFYQPSNLGIESTNSIWQSNGVGVMGTRSVVQPQIEFKLETFGDTVQENYELITTFVQDVLAQKFVTLEYQTENFQVFADLALSSVTKTEGYGFNGQFSETITFDIITKWYTYEELSLILIENGQVSAKSKIYGGYSGSETALQNYNTLKAKPSLNLPNLNLLKSTKSYSYVSTGTTANNSPNVYSLDGTTANVLNKPLTISYEYEITNATGTWSGYIRPTFGFGGTNKTVSNTDFKGVVKQNITITSLSQTSYALTTSGLPAGAKVTITNLKVEFGSDVTKWLPSGAELTTSDISEYYGYKYIKNQAYTYYGEYDIERLTRWDISTDVFSIVGKFVPQSGKSEFGVQFLDDIGNEYTAIVMKPETKPDYIMVNTDVNDEYYQSWTGIVSLNLFPTLNFQRYRTREIKKGQMVMVNLTEAQLRIKRKVDFI